MAQCGAQRTIQMNELTGKGQIRMMYIMAVFRRSTNGRRLPINDAMEVAIFKLQSPENMQKFVCASPNCINPYLQIQISTILEI